MSGSGGIPWRAPASTPWPEPVAARLLPRAVPPSAWPGDLLEHGEVIAERVTEGGAGAVPEFGGVSSRAGSATRRSAWTHRGAIGLSRGPLVGRNQGTRRAPPPRCARRLCARSRRRIRRKGAPNGPDPAPVVARSDPLSVAIPPVPRRAGLPARGGGFGVGGGTAVTGSGRRRRCATRTTGRGRAWRASWPMCVWRGWPRLQRSGTCWHGCRSGGWSWKTRRSWRWCHDRSSRHSSTWSPSKGLRRKRQGSVRHVSEPRGPPHPGARLLPGLGPRSVPSLLPVRGRRARSAPSPGRAQADGRAGIGGAFPRRDAEPPLFGRPVRGQPRDGPGRAPAQPPGSRVSVALRRRPGPTAGEPPPSILTGSLPSGIGKSGKAGKECCPSPARWWRRAGRGLAWSGLRRIGAVPTARCGEVQVVADRGRRRPRERATGPHPGGER